VRAEWAVHGTEEVAVEPTDEVLRQVYRGELPWGATQGAAGKVYAARYRLLQAEIERTAEEAANLPLEVQRLLQYFRLRQAGISLVLAQITTRRTELQAHGNEGAVEAVFAAEAHRLWVGRVQEDSLLAGKAGLLRRSLRRWRLIEADAVKKLSPPSLN